MRRRSAPAEVLIDQIIVYLTQRSDSRITRDGLADNANCRNVLSLYSRIDDDYAA